MAPSDSHYKAVPIGVNGTVTLRGSRIGGFACTAAGTLTLNIQEGANAPVVAINALPVVAGTWIDLPFYVGTNGRSTVVLAGNAAGTLAVA
jgi:hypothetical protein